MIARGAVFEPARLVAAGESLAAGEARVGGKALGLARLAAAGARVPAWFVVPAELFIEHVAAAGRTDAIRRTLGGLHRTSDLGAAAQALRQAVGGLRVAPAPAREIEQALAQLGDGPYAVRSSMVGEDSQARSFAGQLDTFLHRRSAAEVIDAVVRCWASAFSERALAYQLQAGGLGELPHVAVVVQQMIDGEVSGVLFTSNPVNGRVDESVLSACFGLGEGVVSGACDCDEFVVAHDGGERSTVIAEKDSAIVRAASGVGTRTVSLPADQARQRSLSVDEVAALCREGLRIATALGAPQDLEWTRKDGAFYLLQARPITAAALRLPDGPRVVWDNSNIQESYCGVTTPLTFSFALKGYASVYRQTLAAVGVPARTIAAYQPVLDNLLGLVKGRVYYNINNWYRALLLLPSFGRNKEDMERMMGLDSPVDFVADEVLSVGEKLRRLPRLNLTLGRLLVAFAAMDRRVQRFLGDFEAALARFDRARIAGASYSQLMALLEQARVDLIERWHTPILNDLYVMMACGRVRRLVERAAGDEAPSLLASLLAAEEGVESIEPTRLLLRIARAARQRPGAVEALRRGTPSEALAAVRAQHPELAGEIDRYLERYGDRAMGELKLETITLRDDPSFVVQVLRNFVGRPDLDPDALAHDDKARRRAAEDKVLARLAVRERRRFVRALKQARQSIAAREAMRLARTRLFGLHRDLYLAIGQRLREAGRLADARDVLYLTVDEIAAYHDGTAVSADLGALARARRAEFAGYEAEAVPHRLETVGPVHHGNRIAAPEVTAADKAERLLRGIGCSQGLVEAELQVVRSPDDDLAVDGKILTALRTDPGWAPLFPSARGVLVERGSTLSHSAVLARELGIPAVVGVRNLLAIVRSGERVRLDGAAGTVERLGRP